MGMILRYDDRAMNTYDILGVEIDDISDIKLKQLLLQWLNGKGGAKIVTPNPEIILEARDNHEFKKLLNESDLSVPDGIGLSYATVALHSHSLECRHTGVDVFLLLMQLCAEQEKRVLLMGGNPGSAAKSARVLKKVFPALCIEGFDPGRIHGNAGHIIIPDDVLSQIQASKPDTIVVGLGAGKQEKFVQELMGLVPEIKIGIGVGGAFEMVSGQLPRAPEGIRKAGFEWLWRLRLEPKRFKRIMTATIIFPLTIASVTLRQHRFLRACMAVFPEVLKQVMTKK
jgi:N-acetylglucosaminyldiphosphoundecaprenol N-acetyl-beta-D-mannosaminyltransferase